MCCYMSESQFLDLLRNEMHSFLDRMMSVAESEKPECTCFVEKSPANALITSQIRELHPEARFIMCLRSPADVVESLWRSAKTWAPWIDLTNGIPELKRGVESYVHAIATTAA